MTQFTPKGARLYFFFILFWYPVLPSMSVRATDASGNAMPMMVTDVSEWNCSKNVTSALDNSLKS